MNGSSSDKIMVIRQRGNLIFESLLKKRRWVSPRMEA